MHAAISAKRSRVIVYSSDSAVRHSEGIHEFCARHINQAPCIAVGFAHRRIHYFDLIHRESIAIGARLDGADDGFACAHAPTCTHRIMNTARIEMSSL